QLADEYKYVPVRRLALYIEESLYRGTQWVVFEPNDEPLWAQIRLNVGAFMQNLFRQGAFQGRTPREAYLVKCDSETTTQNDINLGIVNILVGFAPLKPAEFVIIKIQQLANKVWNFGSGLGRKVSLKDYRKDIIIEMYNEAGQLVIAYKVYRCWVSEYQAQPDLDANANAIAIQHIKLENEGFERDYAVTEPSEPTFTEPAV